ncbi:MAG: type II secretion system protein, partial [Planctomycetota bacterium]
MNSNIKQSHRKAAFTIVELLTVMSIIVILIGLLV